MDWPSHPYHFRAMHRELWQHHKVELGIIALVTLLLMVFTFTRTRNTTNTRSRIITVERLVEKGTLAHVAPGDTTPFRLSKDAAMVEGRLYSSKPPNFPYVMAAQSWIMKQVTGWSFFPHRKDYIRMLTLVNQVLPYGMMLYLLLSMVRFHTADCWTLRAVLLMASIGSLAYGYAVTINNHTVAAIGLFVAFYLSWLILQQGHTKWWHYALFGLIGSYAATTDLPGGAIVLTLWIVMAICNWRGGVIAALAALIPIISTLGTYYALTGSIEPFYMQFERYKYAGSYWNNPDGLDAIQDPRWVYVFHMLFGHHGFFSLTPVLLVGLVGFVYQGIQTQWKLNNLLLMLVPAVVLIFFFVLFRTSNYGGFTIGARWLIIVMPFFWMAAVPVLERLGKSWYGRSIFALLLLASLPIVGEALYWDGFIRSFVEIWWLGEL